MWYGPNIIDKRENVFSKFDICDEIQIRQFFFWKESRIILAVFAKLLFLNEG